MSDDQDPYSALRRLGIEPPGSADLLSEVPADEAALEAILRDGFARQRWPFAKPPGATPPTDLRRIVACLARIQGNAAPSRPTHRS